MSKIVCDICGTTYDDSTGACPVCGWNPRTTLESTSADDDILNDDFSLDDADSSATPPQKGRAVFDYDAVNTHRRRPPRPAPAPAPAQEEEDEEEESGSNKFLVFILVVLILALLAVSGYIAYTKLWKPKNIGDDSNRPQETVATLPQDGGETVFGDETVATEDPTEVTELTIPCTDLSLVATMDTLTFAGQYWRLMVKYTPEDTTDKVAFTSGDESIATVDANGRITAVSEGKTVIYITCGDKQLTCPVTCQFEQETEPSTEATVAAQAETAAQTEPVETKPQVELKLDRTDMRLQVGYSTQLKLVDCGDLKPEDVEWSVEHGYIAKVENGYVTAIQSGTTEITAKYGDQTVKCIVRCHN